MFIKFSYHIYAKTDCLKIFLIASKIFRNKNVNLMWLLKNSKELLETWIPKVLPKSVPPSVPWQVKRMCCIFLKFCNCCNFIGIIPTIFLLYKTLFLIHKRHYSTLNYIKPIKTRHRQFSTFKTVLLSCRSLNFKSSILEN